VFDPSGAPIPGAQVTIQQQEGSANYKGVTDAFGGFTGPADGGRYMLVVDSQGFQQYVRHDLVSDCKSNSPLAVDVTLQIGALMGEVVTIVNPETNPVGRVWLNFKLLIERALHAI
jgi:hypothetical protein